MRLLNNKDNRNLTINVIASLLIRGIGIIVAFLTVPCYMEYFNNNAVLGIWFTILSILTWVLTFDLGIGNGLRNHLTREISNHNTIESKRLISSAYISLGSVVIVFGIFYYILSQHIDWNEILNIDTSVISDSGLRKSIDISICGVLLSFFLRIIISILYAIQKAAIPNLINLTSHILTLVYLVIITPSGNYDYDLISLSIVHACTTNIPLIIATLYVFSLTQLKECKPSIGYATKQGAKAVVTLGVVFLILQILYMIISTTNEWFISYFYAPEYSTIYQVYNKIFSFASSLFMIALTPVWSAISKALAEKRYEWINKITKIMYIAVCILAILQVIIIPILPYFINLWLGENAIDFNLTYVIWFIIYGTMFAWIAVQSTIASGISKLKVQTYCYTFAVIFKIAAITLLYQYFNDWIFVVSATCVALLPYCVIQPIVIHRQLKQLNNINV